MALRVFGITLADSGPAPVDGTEIVAFRDLGAIVENDAYEVELPDGAALERYTEVVEAVFGQHPVLPAPAGTVFRDRDVLVRWMELHYVALTDALAYVEDRAAARVHICRADGDPHERDKGTDLAAVAAETFRALRRRAVSAVPLKTEHMTGIVLSGAFLIDRELWRDFENTVREERERNPDLRLDLTGPWPPYDFIRMQFGG